MAIPHGVGTWGIIVAIVLSYALGVFTNLTSPVVGYLLGRMTQASVNWLSAWTKSSLERRIAKLENKLAELEKTPAIDDVQNQILWEIKSAKMSAINVGQGVILTIFFGVRCLADPQSRAFADFSLWVLFIVSFGMITIHVMRHHRDFRWVRSAAYRKSLRTEIEGLKKLRDQWHNDIVERKTA